MWQVAANSAWPSVRFKEMMAKVERFRTFLALLQKARSGIDKHFNNTVYVMFIYVACLMCVERTRPPRDVAIKTRFAGVAWDLIDGTITGSHSE